MDDSIASQPASLDDKASPRGSRGSDVHPVMEEAAPAAPATVPNGGAGGLNWNHGSSRPLIRTSLARKSNDVLPKKEAVKTAPLPADDAQSSTPESTPEISPAGGEQQQQQPGAGTKGAIESSRRPVETGGDVDDDDDDLYGETGTVPAAVLDQAALDKVPQRAQNMPQETTISDDDSDILQLRTDDELDQLMINVSDGRDLEALTSWAAHSPDDSKNHSEQPENAPATQKSPSTDEGEIQSEAESDGSDGEEDEMHRYADANAQPSTSNTVSTASHPIATLSSLSAADLLLQVRYFYVGQSPSSIPLSDPAHCLVCMQQGHTSAHCASKACTHCSSPSHPRTSCPSLIPCPRCRQPGHRETQCSAKLKAHADEQLRNSACTLCLRPGHVETECETQWRTSTYPWTADLAPAQGKFRAECYECGINTHLGNDCTSRRPGKPQGTTAWSMRACTAPPKSTARAQYPAGTPARPAPSTSHAPRWSSRRRSPAARSQASSAHGAARRSRSRSYSPPSPATFLRHPLPSHPNTGLPPMTSAPQHHRGATNRRGSSRGAHGGIQIRGVSGRSLGKHITEPPLLHAGGASAGAAGQGQGQGPPASAKRRKDAAGAGAAKRGGKRGGAAAHAGPAETYRPMPSAASKAWTKGWT